jgi:hypothetical protein
MRALIVLVLCFTAGCSWFWPGMVRSSPHEPLFDSSFPLIGGASTDPALCSLATVGPEATVLVSPPPARDRAAQVSAVCVEPARQIAAAGSGRVGELVSVAGTEGYLYRVPHARGILILYSGLAMPAGGWINERFAQAASPSGYATFALIRKEDDRPIYFDPVREARRGLEAAVALRGQCDVENEARIAAAGISMGGMEALIAAREGSKRNLDVQAAVLDPLLDPALAARHLDSFWHSISTDALQVYFRRILSGRYEEHGKPSFASVIERLRDHPDAQTSLPADAPSSWLCTSYEKVTIFLSSYDPVLGMAQREFLRRCPGVAAVKLDVPGHTPLACRLEIFDDMLAKLTEAGTTKRLSSAAREGL